MKKLFLFILMFVVALNVWAFGGGGGGSGRSSTAFSGGVSSIGVHVNPDKPIDPPSWTDCDGETTCDNGEGGEGGSGSGGSGEGEESIDSSDDCYAACPDGQTRNEETCECEDKCKEDEELNSKGECVCVSGASRHCYYEGKFAGQCFCCVGSFDNETATCCHEGTAQTWRKSDGTTEGKCCPKGSLGV